MLMSSHCHLALEQPEPNLAVGMQWRQSTLANRFNRSVRKQGADWKAILACWIKEQTGVSNRWLSEHTHLGAASEVSRLPQNQRRQAQKNRPLWGRLQKCR